jgi:hypothetical protein
VENKGGFGERLFHRVILPITRVEIFTARSQIMACVCLEICG